MERSSRGRAMADYRWSNRKRAGPKLTPARGLRNAQLMPIFTVLGSAGFIGRHLVEYLRGQGHQVWTPPRGEPLGQRDLGNLIYCVGVTTDFGERVFDTVGAHVCHLRELLAESRLERLVYLSSVRLYDMLDGTADEAR